MFDEMSFPAKVGVPSSPPAPASPIGIPHFFPVVELNSSPHLLEYDTHNFPPLIDHTIPSITHHTIDYTTAPGPSKAHYVPLVSSESIDPNFLPSAPHGNHHSPSELTKPPTSHPMVTRAKTSSLKPKSFPNYTVLYSTKHPLRALSTVLQTFEPSCYTHAVLTPKCKAVMGLEFDALLVNGTWALCPRPLHHNIVRNKWIYKIKRKQDGSIKRFKARLVAKGFDQKIGVN